MKKHIALVSICIGALNLQAQDPHFSQFDKMPMLLNPALAGLNYTTQINATYRSQWTSIDAPFNTIAASFDHRFETKGKNSFFGIGLSALSDNAGARTVTASDFRIAASGHVKLDRKSTLGIGIQAGFFQRSLNSSSFQWASQYDGSNFNPALVNAEGTNYNNVKGLDATAGIVYSYNVSDFLQVTANHDKQFTLGATVSHLNKPKNSFNGSDERLPMKFTLFANSLLPVENSNLAIGPAVLFQTQNNFRELLLGARFRYIINQASKFTGFRNASAISLGAFYRNQDAFIAMIQYEISSLCIGLSYDINVSKLSPYSNLRGGYEISLRYAVPNPFGISKARI